MILWWRWRNTEMGEEGNKTTGGEVGAGPISKIPNNKRQSLVPEWSMSEVRTPTHHNSDKPHGLVTSNNNNNMPHLYHFLGGTTTSPQC